MGHELQVGVDVCLVPWCSVLQDNIKRPPWMFFIIARSSWMTLCPLVMEPGQEEEDKGQHFMICLFGSFLLGSCGTKSSQTNLCGSFQGQAPLASPSGYQMCQPPAVTTAKVLACISDPNVSWEDTCSFWILMLSPTRCSPSSSVQMASQEPLMLFLDICGSRPIFKGATYLACRVLWKLTSEPRETLPPGALKIELTQNPRMSTPAPSWQQMAEPSIDMEEKAWGAQVTFQTS